MTQPKIEPGTRRTISGTVQNPREDGSGHYLIDLKGTGWTQDQYAVTAFEVAGEKTLAGLPAGRKITVIVEAQQTRTGKDGSREREWYWRIIGPSNGSAPPSPQEGDAARRKAAALAPDPRGNSIERQVAAYGATTLTAPYMAREDTYDQKEGLTLWTDWADHIIGWIQGTQPSTRDDTRGREPEPDIDESQEPMNASDLPF